MEYANFDDVRREGGSNSFSPKADVWSVAESADFIIAFQKQHTLLFFPLKKRREKKPNVKYFPVSGTKNAEAAAKKDHFIADVKQVPRLFLPS